MSPIEKLRLKGLGALASTTKAGERAQFRGYPYTVIVNLTDSDAPEDWSKKQKTSIEFIASDLEIPPREGENITTTEIIAGVEKVVTHNIEKVIYTGISYRCQCECRRTVNK